MLQPGDKIKWGLADCLEYDASITVTWLMATKGFCTISDLAPTDSSEGTFGSFVEEPGLVFRLDNYHKL